MGPAPTRVLIAGAGVAGLEAILGLAKLAGERVEMTLLAPNREFVYRPLLVAEPFGVGHADRVDLERILTDADARFHHGALSAVDPAARTVATDSGEELSYDALLVALGARPVPALPGALSFSGAAERAEFSELLSELGQRGRRRLVFAVPPRATWTIAAYELALLTAAERDVRRLEGVELALVTHEPEPLSVLGPPASQLARSRLAAAGVELRTGAIAERCEGGRLILAGGEELEADAVVALPGLEVPEIPGLPQREHGFVATDVQMHVFGLERVWAAGDVTSFPIKQGGLAAQQADVAARAIAVRAGAHVPAEAFQPVLRAALLGGEETAYVRTGVGFEDDAVVTAEGSLGWPPGKLAAGHLSPYLLGDDRRPRHVDLEVQPGVEGPSGLALILAAADADAATDDLAGALGWIALAEELNLVIPARYVALRDDWAHRLDPDRPRDRDADRLAGRFASADGALSDLQRRIGWLREIESRTEGEMADHLRHLEQGMEELRALSRRTGIDPEPRSGGVQQLGE